MMLYSITLSSLNRASVRTYLPMTRIRMTTRENIVQNHETIKVGFLSSLVCNSGGADPDDNRVDKYAIANAADYLVAFFTSKG